MLPRVTKGVATLVYRRKFFHSGNDQMTASTPTGSTPMFGRLLSPASWMRYLRNDIGKAKTIN